MAQHPPDPWRYDGSETPTPTPPPLPTPGAETGGAEVVPGYGAGVPGHQPGLRREAREQFSTFMGEFTRTGRFPWATSTRMSMHLATVRLDLRQVLQPGEHLEIDLAAMMSTVKIAVPPGTEVDLRLSDTMGDSALELAGSAAGAPFTGARLLLRGWTVMSTVRVRAFDLAAKPRLGWKWARST